MKSAIRWVPPSYHTIHQVLTNPVYAGAYAYGKSHRERYVDNQGRLRKRTRILPMAEWPVLLPEHHLGYIDWATFQAKQPRIDANEDPQPHRAGGASSSSHGTIPSISSRNCSRRVFFRYLSNRFSVARLCSLTRLPTATQVTPGWIAVLIRCSLKLTKLLNWSTSYAYTNPLLPSRGDRLLVGRKFVLSIPYFFVRKPIGVIGRPIQHNDI
jgi:hypothetical protein